MANAEQVPPESAPEDGARQADYLMLFDLLKHQHDRVRDHTAVFLSVLSALLGFIMWFIAEQTRMTILTKYWFILSASLGGLAASVAWFLVLRRIMADTDLRYFQLRCCECAMKRPHGIFREGRRF